MKIYRTIAALVLTGLFAASIEVSATSNKGDRSRISAGEKRVGPGRGKRHGGGRHGLRGSISKEMMTHLYPVGLVRRHAQDLKLTDSQTKKLRDKVTKVHTEVEDLKWDVDRESQKLGDMVKAGAPLNKVYKQMDAVFRYENKIKKKHLGLLITVREILTNEQRKFLDGVKKTQRGKQGPPL